MCVSNTSVDMLVCGSDSSTCTHLFGRQWGLGGGGAGNLFVKVLNLFLVHLHDNWPLELHGGTLDRGIEGEKRRVGE